MALCFAVCRSVLIAAIAPALIAIAPGVRAEQAPTPGAQSAALAALPPIVRTVLAEALAREKRERLDPERDRWAVSFPLPVCLFEHGQCGAVDRDGRVVVTPRYDFVGNFHEGRAVVRSGGLYGYVDTNGRVVVEPQYAMAGRYKLGVAEVDVDGKSGLIDLQGRQVLAPRFARAVPFNREVFWVNDGPRDFRGVVGSEELHESSFHSGSGNLVFPRGRWGLVDKDARWIREPEFKDITRFDPANLDLMWAQAATGWGLIRPDGTWLVDPTFSHKGDLSDGLAAVHRGGKLGYIDRAGQIAIPLKFDVHTGWTAFVGEMPAPAKLGRRVGLVDRSGNWVLEPAYDSISPMYFGRPAPGSGGEFRGFRAARGGKSGLLDASGNVVVDLVFEQETTPPARREGGGFSIALPLHIYPTICPDGRVLGLIDRKPRFFTQDGKPIELVEGSLALASCDAPHAVKVGEKFGYVDAAMRPVTPAKFESVGWFRDGLAPVTIDGKQGLIRKDGTFALEPVFDAVQSVQDNLALVQVGRDASLIDMKTAVLVTSRQFEGACALGRGVIGVVVAGKAGAIDLKGRSLLEPNYEPWRFNYAETLTPVQSGGKWGFVDWAGHAIEARFSAVRPFGRGLAWGKTGETWCPIDRRGERIPGIACRSADPDPHTRHLPARPVSCQIGR
jgi:hypothetical protein